MTPSCIYSDISNGTILQIFTAYYYQSHGARFSDSHSYTPLVIRPVLSLKSCVTVSSGNGTSDEPYEVEIDAVCAMSEN